MIAENFSDDKLNGIYELDNIKFLEFNEQQHIYYKQDIKLVLWYDFNNTMYGGKLCHKNNDIKVYSFYDMKNGWGNYGKGKATIKPMP